MTFDEILEQVVTLLERQGRVSYRALKRRFDIDDDYIADLKEHTVVRNGSKIAFYEHGSGDTTPGIRPYVESHRFPGAMTSKRPDGGIVHHHTFASHWLTTFQTSARWCV